MYRIPLEDCNSNFDTKFNTCQSTRNCNQPKINFSVDRTSRTISGRSNNVKNQFDVMCFLMGVELERLNQENDKLKHQNLEIKESTYENKNYEFQLKDLSERLVKKELQCQKLENQLTDTNKMIVQKELLVQNQYSNILQNPIHINKLINNYRLFNNYSTQLNNWNVNQDSQFVKMKIQIVKETMNQQINNKQGQINQNFLRQAINY